jgi:hypothetical protein
MKRFKENESYFFPEHTAVHGTEHADNSTLTPLPSGVRVELSACFIKYHAMRMCRRLDI